jgi:molybdate transport system substrate-binding protein
MNRVIPVLLASAFAAASASAADSPSIHLYSAGSLRTAMTDIAKNYAAAYGVEIEPVYGASTALGERLAKGEPGDIFTSADLASPEMLSQSGKGGPPVLFARNHLCAVSRPGLNATTATLLTTMLDPAVKIATSTPKNDPGGDYAWAMFAKADAIKPGSRATLETKAIKIGSVPGSLPIPPNAGNPVVWLFREKRADIFLSYCTNGAAAAAEMSGITTIALPPELAVEAGYGLTVLQGANKDRASQFAFYILSPAGQKILAAHGFDAPLLPKP